MQGVSHTGEEAARDLQQLRSFRGANFSTSKQASEKEHDGLLQDNQIETWRGVQ